MVAVASGNVARQTRKADPASGWERTATRLPRCRISPKQKRYRLLLRSELGDQEIPNPPFVEVFYFYGV